VDLQLYCQHSLTINQPQHCFICRPADSSVSEDALDRTQDSSCNYGIGCQTLSPLGQISFSKVQKISKNSHFNYKPIILTLLPNASAIQKLYSRLWSYSIFVTSYTEMLYFMVNMLHAIFRLAVYSR
jgi:hypothetical protein